MEYHHRGWIIEHRMPPVPEWLGIDWQAVHQDYDGPEDGRCFNARSFEACVKLIDEIEEVDT